MPSRRLLLAIYPFPPMPSVGANRWLAMRRYLREMGHEVTTLTTRAFGELPDDIECRVHRAGDLTSAGWLRHLMGRGDLPKPGMQAQVDSPPGKLITGVIVPDPYAVTWVPAAVLAARRMLDRGSFDCLITTSAYDSTHLLALALGPRRPAWIADFRDGWTFDPVKQRFPTTTQRRFDSWLERRVVTRADRVVSAVQPIARDFRARFGVDAGYVPNGWDPSVEPALESVRLPEAEGPMCNLVHTGTMTGPWGRDPTALLMALKRISADGRQPIRLILAGRITTDERAILDRFAPDVTIRHVGQLSRESAIALQRRADALILITSPRTVSELSGKIFEYFGANRPILALADGNEAARIVTETRTGWAVPPDDVVAITEALRGVLDGRLEAEFSPTGLKRYTYPAPAERMAEEVELAISARARRS